MQLLRLFQGDRQQFAAGLDAVAQVEHAAGVGGVAPGGAADLGAPQLGQGLWIGLEEDQFAAVGEQEDAAPKTDEAGVGLVGAAGDESLLRPGEFAGRGVDADDVLLRTEPDDVSGDV